MKSCSQIFGDLTRVLVAMPRLELLLAEEDLCDTAWSGRSRGAVVSVRTGLISGSAP